MALDTNWFIDGASYICSYDGNDANNPATKAAPKKTIAATNLVAGDNIIRSGVYYPSENTLEIGTKNLIGDSENVYIYIGSGLQSIRATTGSVDLKNIKVVGVTDIMADDAGGYTYKYEDCWFEQINTLQARSQTITNPTRRTLFKNIPNLLYNTNAGTICHFIGCTFIDCTISGFTKAQNFDDAVFINCYFQNCTFKSLVGSGQTVSFQNCVFDHLSQSFGTVGALDGDLFQTLFTNNLTSETTMATNIKKGTFNESYGTSNTVSFNGCYWVTSGGTTNIFNDEDNDDYTLYTDGVGTVSVLYNEGFPIGKFGLSLPFNSKSPAFTNGTKSPDVTLNATTGTFDLNAPATEGFVQSEAIDGGTGNHIKIPFAILLTDAIRFIGQVFNSPSKQVVDETLNAAASNARFTFWLKYKDTTTNNIMPVPQDTDDSNPNNWYEIEQGNIFGVETDGSKGNGNVDVDIAGGLSPIRAKEFQVRFTIRNNGN